MPIARFVRAHPIRAGIYTLAAAAVLYGADRATRQPFDDLELFSGRVAYQGTDSHVEYRHQSGGGRKLPFVDISTGSQDNAILKVFPLGASEPKPTLDEFIYNDGTGTGVEIFRTTGNGGFEYVDKTGRVFVGPHHNLVISEMIKEAQRDFKSGDKMYKELSQIVAQARKETVGAGIP